MTRFQTKCSILFFGLLFFILVQNYQSQWNQLPNGMHTWTQSDHFELTNGFVANNLDFFHPQTKIYAVYNQDFPRNWVTADSTTITSVDFPIHQYIPAVLMKVFNSPSPIFSQLYFFILGFIGLIFVFRLAFLVNKSMILSAVITCFVCFSPVYSYYHIRFIPSIPSFSLAMIGLFYYFKYRENERISKFIILAVFFLTLAALGRMTFLIPLLGVLGLEFIRLVKQKENRKLKWTIGLSSVFLFLGYFVYNGFLKETYGTLFLTALNPAKSFAELKEICQLIYQNWKWEYITGYHYGLIGILLVSIISSLFRKNRLNNAFEIAILSCLIAGSLVFFFAMSAQFVHHDYYFIDNFLISLTVFMCIFSRFLLFKSPFLKVVLPIVLILGVVGMFFSNLWIQKNRAELEKWGGYAGIASDFSDSKQFLHELGIPKSNKLLLLMSTAPNYALHFMDRNAYVSLKNDPKRLKRLFQFRFDYVIFQNEWFMREIYANNPSIIQELKTVGTNGKITVCKMESVPEQSIYSLFQLNKRKATFEAMMRSKSAMNFKNLATNRVQEDSIWRFNSVDEFGPMIQIQSKNLFLVNRFLLVEGECRMKKSTQLSLVVSAQEQKETTFYQSFPIVSEASTDWKKFQFFITVPIGKKSEMDFASYIYNPNHEQYEIRNLSMKVY